MAAKSLLNLPRDQPLPLPAPRAPLAFPRLALAARTSQPPSARRCLRRGHPPGDGPQSQHQPGMGNGGRGYKAWQRSLERSGGFPGLGMPGGRWRLRRCPAQPGAGATEGSGAPSCAGRDLLTLPPPRPPGRLVGTNTSCSGPGPRSWPGGGGGALPKRPQGRSSGFPQAHTRGRPGAALGPLPAVVGGGGPVCVRGWGGGGGGLVRVVTCPESSRGRRAAPCVWKSEAASACETMCVGSGSVLRGRRCACACVGNPELVRSPVRVSVSVCGCVTEPGCEKGNVRGPRRVSQLRGAANV